MILFIFLQVNYSDHMTFGEKIKRIDFLGNAVLIASTVAILYALAYAGASYTWASWHILVPLLLGFFGFLIFGYTQGGRIAAAEPVMPLRLFKHRTSIIVSINTFMNSALTFWGVFFLVSTEFCLVIPGAWPPLTFASIACVFSSGQALWAPVLRRGSATDVSCGNTRIRHRRGFHQSMGSVQAGSCSRILRVYAWSGIVHSPESRHHRRSVG